MAQAPSKMVMIQPRIKTGLSIFCVVCCVACRAVFAAVAIERKLTPAKTQVRTYETFISRRIDGICRCRSPHGAVLQ
jgi:hypothetical protein